MTNTQERWYGTGRRKAATARVWIEPGDGKIVVNKRPVENFFPRESLRLILQQPLEVIEQKGKVNVLANVCGGGLSGQAGAVRHGITRALIAMKAEFRSPLKKAGFVTRDAREVERKKYGRPGARKRYQYSKR